VRKGRQVSKVIPGPRVRPAPKEKPVFREKQGFKGFREIPVLREKLV
jgi:hypothetical protein